MSEKLVVELTPQEAQLIINVLHELPYKVSAKLISDLYAQIEAQKPKEETKD